MILAELFLLVLSVGSIMFISYLILNNSKKWTKYLKYTRYRNDIVEENKPIQVMEPESNNGP